MPKYDSDDIKIATRNLRRALRPGQTVYFVVTHVARSGMQRSIEFYIPGRSTESRAMPDGTYKRVTQASIERITWEISRVLGYRIDPKNGGVIVGGCGMDMGFHVVYTLGMKLWPKGTRNPHGMRNVAERAALVAERDQLIAELAARGGRGIDLADRIDRLNHRLGESEFDGDPSTGVNGAPDSTGGYALKSRQM